MLPDQIKQAAANTGSIVGFFIWFMAHIAQINEVAQFLLFVASTVGVILGAVYHWKRIRKDQ